MSALHLTKIQRRQVEVARQEISPWGLASAIEMGGKHLVLKVWSRSGEIHRITIACTPRNGGDALDITRQRSKRLLRQINAREGY
ncbi:hypothetical protein [Brevundimonas sp.]|uniref:hypothetical protein n=1 Tax=Brevundimonas sp. TaxID=1871086 RepID=UPI002601BEDD|nr:hypothetical protein [Brevundimonas sp.]